MNHLPNKRWIVTAPVYVVMGFILLYFSPPASAENAGIQIEIAGLLGDKKAVLIINGQQKILETGADGYEGIKLVAVQDEGVILEMDGQQDYYALGNKQIATRFTQAEKISEQVFRDSSGMFYAAGSINGYPVSFLVDTGASIIAMSGEHAKRLGIQYRSKGQATTVATASGNTGAHAIRLDTVGVGRIKLNNIEAVVIEGAHPQEILLGMSFLRRLNVRNEDAVMVLETKF